MNGNIVLAIIGVIFSLMGVFVVITKEITDNKYRTKNKNKAEEIPPWLKCIDVVRLNCLIEFYPFCIDNALETYTFCSENIVVGVCLSNEDKIKAKGDANYLFKAALKKVVESKDFKLYLSYIKNKKKKEYGIVKNATIYGIVSAKSATKEIGEKIFTHQNDIITQNFELS